MPTGYTAPVADGEIVEFNEFAWNCARAFGALYFLRDADEGKDGQRRIPKTLPTVCDWNQKRLQESVAALAAFEKMSPKRLVAAYEKHVRDAKETGKKYAAEVREKKLRYNTMLKKVRAWESPSSDHEEFKKFMIQQLEESIQFDCGHTYKPEWAKSIVIFVAQRIASLNRDIEYHTKEHAAEVERTAGRNAWITKLAESLDAKGA